MGNLVQNVTDAALHPIAQGATYASAGWAVFGVALQYTAGTVTIVLGLLQIGLIIERRWFSKRRNRRNGE
jgi:hypothetical protein